MSLEKTVVPVVIGGQDAGTDPKVLAGGWSRVENAVHPRAGAIAKRPGQRSIAVTAGNTRITRTAKGPLLWGGSRPTILSATTNAEQVVDLPTGWAHYRAEVTRYGTEPINACGVSGNILATASGEAGHITTRDRATGAVITTRTQVGSDVCRHHFVEMNGGLDCWLFDVTTWKAAKLTINTTTGAIGTLQPVTAGLAANGVNQWDQGVAVVTAGGTPYVCVAYYGAAGGAVQLVVMPNGAVGSAVAYSVATALSVGTLIAHPIAAFAVGENVGITWIDEYTVAGPATEWEIMAIVINPLTGATVTSATTIERVVSTSRPPRTLGGVSTVRAKSTANTVAHIVFDYATYLGGAGTMGVSAFPPSRKMVEVELISTAGVGSRGVSMYTGRSQPIAAPLKLASGRYITPVYSQAWGVDYPDGAYYRDMRVNWCINGDGTAEQERAAWVGRTLTDMARTNPHSAVAYPNLVSDRVVAFLADDGSVYLPMATLYRPDPSPGGGGGYYSGATAPESEVVIYAIVRMVPTSDVDAVESDGSVYIGGAGPARFDGTAIIEHGFNQAPDGLIVTGMGGGALTAGARYNYQAVYEYTDASGQREQGRPSSAPVSVSGSTAYIVKASNLTHTNKWDRIDPGAGTRRAALVFYRTLANQERPFYRVGSAYMTISSDFGSYTDVTADSVLARNEQLYTTGGIVEYSGPPPYDRSTVHGTRHCVVSADDGRLYYSLPATRGQPFHHSAILSANASVGLERVTAMRSHADRLVLFTPSALSVIDGTGYNALGVGDNFREPYPIIGAPGCTTSRSIVAIPGMLAYGAPDSLWALNSRFQSEPIGGPVQYYLDTQTIVDAAALPDRTLAVWACASGPAIVYDYAADAWGVWTNHDSLAACAYAGGTLARLSSAKVYLTDGTRYDDDGAFVTMRAITGWLAVSAWQRIYELLLLGQARDTANLKVALGYDHDPAWTDTFTFALAGLRPFGVEAYYGDGLALADYADQAATLRVFPSRQKCGALRVQISDAQVGGAASARGYELSALQLLAGAKTGVKRVSPARQIRS